jgi:hypothetical protein
VEWAEERQRLKALCGDGLKIGDIDRLYKEKKRASFQQREQEYLDTESYLLRDGRIIYRKETYRGTLEKTVVDWTATALYQTCQIDDDGKETHTTALELRRGEFVKKLDAGDVFVDDACAAPLHRIQRRVTVRRASGHVEASGSGDCAAIRGLSHPPPLQLHGLDGIGWQMGVCLPAGLHHGKG